MAVPPERTRYGFGAEVPAEILLFQALVKAMRGRVTVRKLIRTAAEVLGVQIHIHREGNRAWDRVTGLALEWQTGWRILVRRTDSRLYQDHVILHELTHLLCKHPPCVVYRSPDGGTSGTLYARPASFDHLEADEQAVELEAEAGAFFMADILVTPPSEREEEIL